MLQKIIIIGNLGRDPEMRYVGSEAKPVTNMNVAVNRKWTDANGQPKEETTWFRTETWGPQAEAIHEHMAKGRQVYVEGRLKCDPETGGPRIYAKNDGMAGAAFEIVTDNVRFLGTSGNGNGSGNGTANGTGSKGVRYSSPTSLEAVNEDEIPF
jgi:single-strand DNA-binding protein